MSKLQINMKQSELLMAIRCILNCQNEDIIGRVSELAELEKNSKAVREAMDDIKPAQDNLVIRCNPEYFQKLATLVSRDTPMIPRNISRQDNFLCGSCECGAEIVQWRHNFCPACGQRIAWGDE